MPYKSDKQRRYMHAQHPEIAAKWDAEIAASKKPKKKKVLVSKARKDYAPKPLMKPMTDEQLARAHDRQKVFSLTGSALGLTGLSLLGAAAVKRKPNPIKAEKLNRYATNTSVTAGGIGALSGINFARIQGEESRRAREIKKSNYGAGYSQFYEEQKRPFTISPKAHDPELSRERRAATYPYLMGAGAVGTGALTVREAMKKSPPKTEKVKVKTKANKSKMKKLPLKDMDKKILRSKPLRVTAGAAATGGLAYGAYYNARENNRRSYADQWYRG